jgi:hypothetical protein
MSNTGHCNEAIIWVVIADDVIQEGVSGTPKRADAGAEIVLQRLLGPH